MIAQTVQKCWKTNKHTNTHTYTPTNRHHWKH